MTRRVFGIVVVLIATAGAATSDMAGIRWTNPAGSPYADVPDAAQARGSFVRDARLFTLLLDGGTFSVWSWDTGTGTWTPWSRPERAQPVVNGQVNHVRIAGPREIIAFLDVGAADDDESVRQCEEWSIAIDDETRTLTWVRLGAERRNLRSISNYGGEAEEYFRSLKAKRLRAERSPARISEQYVVGSATKENAVAFAVGRGLHVYSLPDRRNGLVSPVYRRSFALSTAQIGTTPAGWFMVARLRRGSWPGHAIVFVDEELEPTGVVPLPAHYHPKLETAGDGYVVFADNHKDAWVITANVVKRIQWSEPIEHGHIAATADPRRLFLTNGERVAIPVNSVAVAQLEAVALSVGSAGFIVSPKTKAGAIGALSIGAIALVAFVGALRKRRTTTRRGA